MKNITLSVDEETYRQARIAAAERNTRVSALVRDYWRGFARPASAEADPLLEPEDIRAALGFAVAAPKGSPASRN